MEILTIDIMILALGGLGSFIALLIKRLLSRLDKLEQREHLYMSEKEIRYLVDDKVDPVKERMTRIESKLDEIISILVRK